MMGWESFCVVRFDLGPLIQGQTGIAKLKISYNSLIVGPRGLDGKPTYRKSWAVDVLVGFDLTSLVRGQTRITKLKSAYNSLIIGPRGL